MEENLQQCQNASKNKAVECLSRMLYLLRITFKRSRSDFCFYLVDKQYNFRERIHFLKFFVLFLIQFDDVDVNTFIIISKPNEFDIRDLSKHDNQGNIKISKAP